MEEFRACIIRHGKTDENLKGAYIGAGSEVALGAEGIKELREVKASLLSQLQPQEYIVSSPSSRCIETARLLFEREPDLILPELKEINFGKWEGKSYELLKGDSYYQSWIDSGGTLPFPEGESRDEFIKRTFEGFNRALAHRKEIVIVAHGGTVMAILSSLTGGQYFDFQVENLGGYKIRGKKEGNKFYEISYSGINSRLHN